MAGFGVKQALVLAVASLWLAGCQMGTGPKETLTADGQPIVDATVNAPTSVQLIDRDVEAPELFQTEGQALWDGRPSLGGVWVATPDAKDPQRVIMRNPANGKFVIGALFRRERDNPGPKLQISSDAADALGMLAGEPGKITVTALRRAEAAPAAPDATAPILDSAEPAAAATATAAATADVTATAAQAIDKAANSAKAATPPPPKPQAKPAAAAVVAPAVAPAAAPAAAPVAVTPVAPAAAVTQAPLTAVDPKAAAAPPTPTASTGAWIQIGTFSVEENANVAVAKLKKAGIDAVVKKGDLQGKAFWSVSTRGDAALLAKIKAAGFPDAYVLK